MRDATRGWLLPVTSKTIRVNLWPRVRRGHHFAVASLSRTSVNNSNNAPFFGFSCNWRTRQTATATNLLLPGSRSSENSSCRIKMIHEWLFLSHCASACASFYCSWLQWAITPPRRGVCLPRSSAQLPLQEPVIFSRVSPTRPCRHRPTASTSTCSRQSEFPLLRRKAISLHVVESDSPSYTRPSFELHAAVKYWGQHPPRLERIAVLFVANRIN